MSALELFERTHVDELKLSLLCKRQTFGQREFILDVRLRSPKKCLGRRAKQNRQLQDFLTAHGVPTKTPFALDRQKTAFDQHLEMLAHASDVGLQKRGNRLDASGSLRQDLDDLQTRLLT